MLELCGQPYPIELMDLQFNMQLLLTGQTPSEIGMKAWSVVDLVVETDPMASSGVEQWVGKECLANYLPVLAKEPDCGFIQGELQNMTRLIVKLSGRFTGI